MRSHLLNGCTDFKIIVEASGCGLILYSPKSHLGLEMTPQADSLRVFEIGHGFNSKKEFIILYKAVFPIVLRGIVYFLLVPALKFIPFQSRAT